MTMRGCLSMVERGGVRCGWERCVDHARGALGAGGCGGGGGGDGDGGGGDDEDDSNLQRLNDLHSDY